MARHPAITLTLAAGVGVATGVLGAMTDPFTAATTVLALSAVLVALAQQTLP